MKIEDKKLFLINWYVPEVLNVYMNEIYKKLTTIKLK